MCYPKVNSLHSKITTSIIHKMTPTQQACTPAIKEYQQNTAPHGEITPERNHSSRTPEPKRPWRKAKEHSPQNAEGMNYIPELRLICVASTSTADNPGRQWPWSTATVTVPVKPEQFSACSSWAGVTNTCIQHHGPKRSLVRDWEWHKQNMALWASRSPASLLSSALGKIVWRVKRSISPAHAFPFFPCSARSQTTTGHKGDLVPSPPSNWPS